MTMSERLKQHFSGAYEAAEELAGLIRRGQYRRRVVILERSPGRTAFEIVEERLDPATGRWRPYGSISADPQMGDRADRA